MSAQCPPTGLPFPQKCPGEGRTHRAVAHAGGRRQRLLRGLALPQRAWLGRAQRPLAGQQVAQNVAVTPQCTVDQRALAFLIQVVHLGRGAGAREGTAEHHFVTVTHMCCGQAPSHRRCNPPQWARVPLCVSGESVSELLQLTHCSRPRVPSVELVITRHPPRSLCLSRK